jgi:putative hydrolase of the HAD superfamily
VTTSDQPAVLLIDMGGVFFSYSFWQALAYWAGASGQDLRVLRARWQIDTPFDAFERGEIPPVGYLEHLRRLLGLDLDDDQMTAGWNAIYSEADAELVTLLASAEVRARFRVAGVSNTNVLHAGCWRQLFGEQLKILDTVWCSHEIGATKPAPGFFERVAAGHGTSPDRLVLVDDIPEVTDAARALGLRAHRYQDASSLAAYLDTL